MSLRIGAAVRVGIRRSLTRAGLTLAVGFALVGLVAGVGTQTLVLELFRPVLETLRTQPPARTGFSPSDVRLFATTLDAASPLALGLPASVGAGLVVGAGLFAEALRIVAVRVFAETPRSSSLRPLSLPTLNGVLGGAVVWFLTGLGGVLGIAVVVVGGPVIALFLATSFLFVRQEVALQDRNFVDALNESWQVASGHRFRLLGLGVAVVVLTALPNALLRVLAGVALGPAAAAVTGAVVSGALAVFGTAAVTHAYTQLRAESDEPVDEPDRIY